MKSLVLALALALSSAVCFADVIVDPPKEQKPAHSRAAVLGGVGGVGIVIIVAIAAARRKRAKSTTAA